jgi:hypothetical protein
MKIYNLKKNPIGANITMQDIKTKNIYNNYVSFGKYINNQKGTDCDSFGIADMEIFENFVNENDLKSYVNGVFTEDFKLLSYELYYTNNNWQKIKQIIKQYRSN